MSNGKHEHSLVPTSTNHPYYCPRCDQIGFGSSYTCSKSECNLFYHEQCENPTRLVEHPFSNTCVLKFYTNGPGLNSLCRVCGNEIKGYHYRCKCKLKILKCKVHPFCLSYEQTLVTPDGLTLHLKEQATAKCLQCGTKDSWSGPSGWAYESSCGNYCYHVSCMMEIINANWRNEFISRNSDDFHIIETFITKRFVADKDGMHQQIMETFMKEFEYLKLQLKEIELSTGNFSEKNVIGGGGFGTVYKGELTHYKGRSMVACKRLDPKWGQGPPEFWKEIMMLSRYTHENLISLLGFCDQGGEKILVYEHVSRGSLDRYLSASHITWTQRIKICLDAARGLSYLHDPKGTQQRVLHRDVKSANILLNDNWNAKVSDMGLSRFLYKEHTTVMTAGVGTPGYCDPAYAETCLLTQESDVYSFGVVLFEVFCGRLCFEKINGQVLVSSWKESYEKKELHKIMFQDLEQQMDPSSVESFLDIAYECLKRMPKERPKMTDVVAKLEVALKYQELYETTKGIQRDY